jgi:hypothetical protein
MFKVPEKYRVTSSNHFATDSSYGNNGVFIIPLSNRSTAYTIASDGESWEHVSVHIVSDGKDRTPTWTEMCKIKDMFWGDDDCVVQYHPPKSDYVNNHKHTLHLWRPVNIEIPRPDSILVGIK